MSVDYCGRIQNLSVDNKLFKILVEDFFERNGFRVLDVGMDMVYEIYNKRGHEIMSIELVYNVQEPYNRYMSELVEDGFTYSQCIFFTPVKEELCEEIDFLIIQFLLSVHRQILDEILVTSEACDDICIIKNGKVTWRPGISFQTDIN